MRRREDRQIDRMDERCSGWAVAGQLLMALALICVSLNGCEQGSDPQAARVEPPPPESLHDRAEQLWQARQEEDWSTVYRFQLFPEGEEVAEADFAQWSENEEPFRYPSFRLGESVSDGEFGWVEVTCQTAMRRFPDLPPREVSRWEKWRRVDGVWFPVPADQLESYPTAPAERDLPEEARLRQRFEESWAVRLAQDWQALYEMCDPADLPDDPEARSVPKYLPLQFLEYELLWLEVIGDHGSIRLIMTHRIDDPSLSKLPPQRLVMTEQWVKRDGQWYLDLSNPPG